MFVKIDVGLERLGVPAEQAVKTVSAMLELPHLRLAGLLARLQARPPDAVHLVLLDHRLRIVGAEPDVLPQAQEIDLGRIFEAQTTAS